MQIITTGIDNRNSIWSKLRTAWNPRLAILLNDGYSSSKSPELQGVRGRITPGKDHARRKKRRMSSHINLNGDAV